VSRERRLGRGLAALLGTPLEDELHAEAIASTNVGSSSLAAPSAPSPEPLASASGGLLQLPVNEIEENPFQPRRDFSDVEIASLAESLKEHDMLQPVLVRRVEGRYQLISGERRLRAARHAGWTTIPARVRDADDRLVAELAIVENLQRKDLNAVEKALSFKRYLDEHRCTQDDLARRLKIDRSTIANLMRLLELPESILGGIRKGTITAGHARALLPLDDEHEQVAFAKRIETEGLSVRDVERYVAERLGEDEPVAEILPGPGKKPRTRTDQVASLEQEFRLALGVKVEIKANSRGRGKLVIHFGNHDEFDRLREQLTDNAGGDQRRKVG
jgi:ParB family chromosome partitioning protein